MRVTSSATGGRLTGWVSSRSQSPTVTFRSAGSASDTHSAEVSTQAWWTSAPLQLKSWSDWLDRVQMAA